MTFAILCTGPSMSQAVANSVRHLRVIAVNKAFELAPWAEALAANDRAFWKTYPAAHDFAGAKYSHAEFMDVQRVHAARSDWSSGCVALEVARLRGARRVLMFGLDFHGGHYFGDYAEGCHRATTAWERHRAQFIAWRDAHPDVAVLNCTPGSVLGVFPIIPESLAWKP